MPQVLNDVKRFSTNFYKIVKFHFWSFFSHTLRLMYSLPYYQKYLPDSRFDSTSELPLDTAPSICLQVKYVEKAKSGYHFPSRENQNTQDSAEQSAYTWVFFLFSQ